MFHEALHWQKVGLPDIDAGPKYRKFRENPDDPLNMMRFVGDPTEIAKYKTLNPAFDYLKKKTEQALYSNADEYLSRIRELQTNGLEAGKAIGIKPFAKYPGLKKAIKAIDKAREYNPFLNDIKAGSENEVKNAWKIITGQYTPAVIVGGSLTSSLYNNR